MHTKQCLAVITCQKGHKWPKETKPVIITTVARAKVEKKKKLSETSPSKFGILRKHARLSYKTLSTHPTRLCRSTSATLEGAVRPSVFESRRIKPHKLFRCLCKCASHRKKRKGSFVSTAYQGLVARFITTGDVTRTL